MLFPEHLPRRLVLFPQFAVVLLTLAACHKSPTPATQAPPLVPPPVQASPTPSPATAMPLAPPPSAGAPGEKDLTLEDMSYAVQAWFTSRGATPKNLQELVKAGFIKKLPTPPPGQEFAIDPKTLRVVLVNR
ncbi:MAG: hypothetical protein HY300_05825 [Verrucomicrobia bacterium]|nr:hypothetical protein [Verrucomicrobiota bacterium]